MDNPLPPASLEEKESELELLLEEELDDEKLLLELEELDELDEEGLELLEEEELELLLGLGSNSNESPPPAELLDESPSSTSWYRLTSVSTVSPSLPGGIVSFER